MVSRSASLGDCAAAGEARAIAGTRNGLNARTHMAVLNAFCSLKTDGMTGAGEQSQSAVKQCFC
jgi:hypothetical protein